MKPFFRIPNPRHRTAQAVSGKRTLRRELSLSIIGMTLLSALVYTSLLEWYYERGFVETSHVSLRMEMRDFVQRYAANPDIPLPDSLILSFYLDDWQQIPEFYRSKFSREQLHSTREMSVDWFPNGEYEWEGSHYIVARSELLADGRRLYGFVDYDTDLMTTEEKADFDRFFTRIFLVGGLFILLMSMIVIIFGRQLNKHTQHLANWADNLALENLNQPVPNFRYQEFNRISDRLMDAFQRISGLLEREHRFLRNASHELRTPIAVIRANMELLDKIGYQPTQERPMERINRASQGMLQITKTLLWISREKTDKPTESRVCLHQLTEELTEDLGYLLKDKPVTLDFSPPTEQIERTLARTPLRIVLTNLIRNAFQHTQEGEVMIRCQPDRLIIENRDQGLAHGDSEDSYGLGLMLSQQICERMNWQLALEHKANGVYAVLTLSDSQQK